MKKLFLALMLCGLSVTADSATLYTLVSCEYKFLVEYSGSVWIGTYESQFGNYFTFVFTDGPCPSTLYQ